MQSAPAATGVAAGAWQDPLQRPCHAAAHGAGFAAQEHAWAAYTPSCDLGMPEAQQGPAAALNGAQHGAPEPAPPHGNSLWPPPSGGAHVGLVPAAGGAPRAKPGRSPTGGLAPAAAAVPAALYDYGGQAPGAETQARGAGRGRGGGAPQPAWPGGALRVADEPGGGWLTGRADGRPALAKPSSAAPAAMGPRVVTTRPQVARAAAPAAPAAAPAAAEAAPAPQDPALGPKLTSAKALPTNENQRKGGLPAPRPDSVQEPRLVGLVAGVRASHASLSGPSPAQQGAAGAAPPGETPGQGASSDAEGARAAPDLAAGRAAEARQPQAAPANSDRAPSPGAAPHQARPHSGGARPPARRKTTPRPASAGGPAGVTPAAPASAGKRHDNTGGPAPASKRQRAGASPPEGPREAPVPLTWGFGAPRGGTLVLTEQPGGIPVDRAEAAVAGEDSDKPRGPLPRTSKFKGVTKHRRSGRWEAHVWVREEGKQAYLGGRAPPPPHPPPSPALSTNNCVKQACSDMHASVFPVNMQRSLVGLQSSACRSGLQRCC